MYSFWHILLPLADKSYLVKNWFENWNILNNEMKLTPLSEYV